MIRDVDERRKGGELHSSDRLQQKLGSTHAHTHVDGRGWEDECANVDMERTAIARAAREKKCLDGVLLRPSARAF